MSFIDTFRDALAARRQRATFGGNPPTAGPVPETIMRTFPLQKTNNDLARYLAGNTLFHDTYSPTLQAFAGGELDAARTAIGADATKPRTLGQPSGAATSHGLVSVIDQLDNAAPVNIAIPVARVVHGAARPYIPLPIPKPMIRIPLRPIPPPIRQVQSNQPVATPPHILFGPVTPTPNPSSR